MSRYSQKIRQDGKVVGCVNGLDSPTDQIFFAITVDRARADYLMRCLDEPLCKGCGREEAECSADPCPGVRLDRGEIEACDWCGQHYDPLHLKNGICVECKESGH